MTVMKYLLKYNELYLFMRYALTRKEIEDINNELNNSDGIENIIEIQLSNMDPTNIMVFRIPINITIDEDDTWNDIHDKLIECIKKTNIYNYLRSVIID